MISIENNCWVWRQIAGEHLNQGAGACVHEAELLIGEPGEVASSLKSALSVSLINPLFKFSTWPCVEFNSPIWLLDDELINKNQWGVIWVFVSYLCELLLFEGGMLISHEWNDDIISLLLMKWSCASQLMSMKTDISLLFSILLWAMRRYHPQASLLCPSILSANPNWVLSIWLILISKNGVV